MFSARTRKVPTVRLPLRPLNRLKKERDQGNPVPVTQNHRKTMIKVTKAKIVSAISAILADLPDVSQVLPRLFETVKQNPKTSLFLRSVKRISSSNLHPG
jgi:hypothetical protein